MKTNRYKINMLRLCLLFLFISAMFFVSARPAVILAEGQNVQVNVTAWGAALGDSNVAIITVDYSSAAESTALEGKSEIASKILINGMTVSEYNLGGRGSNLPITVNFMYGNLYFYYYSSNPFASQKFPQNTVIELKKDMPFPQSGEGSAIVLAEGVTLKEDFKMTFDGTSWNGPISANSLMVFSYQLKNTVRIDLNSPAVNTGDTSPDYSGLLENLRIIDADNGIQKTISQISGASVTASGNRILIDIPKSEHSSLDRIGIGLAQNTLLPSGTILKSFTKYYIESSNCFVNTISEKLTFNPDKILEFSNLSDLKIFASNANTLAFQVFFKTSVISAEDLQTDNYPDPTYKGLDLAKSVPNLYSLHGQTFSDKFISSGAYDGLINNIWFDDGAGNAGTIKELGFKISVHYHVDKILAIYLQRNGNPNGLGFEGVNISDSPSGYKAIGNFKLKILKDYITPTGYSMGRDVEVNYSCGDAAEEPVTSYKNPPALLIPSTEQYFLKGKANQNFAINELLKFTYFPAGYNHIPEFKYSSDNTDTLTVNESGIITIKNSGSCKIKVWSDSLTAVAEIPFTVKKSSQIILSQVPSSTSYSVGQMLNMMGAVIEIRYGEGESDTIECNKFVLPEGISVSGFDTSKVSDDVDITVNYFGNPIGNFKIAIVSPQISGIESFAPYKTVYYTGEELSLIGGYITPYYQNGLYGENILLTDNAVTVSGYNKNLTGIQSLTVSYGAKQHTFNVTVKPLSIIMTVFSMPSKTMYSKGESLDLSDGYLTFYYNNDTSMRMELTNPQIKIEGYNEKATGNQIVMITYGDQTKLLYVTVEPTIQSSGCGGMTVNGSVMIIICVFIIIALKRNKIKK